MDIDKLYPMEIGTISGFIIRSHETIGRKEAPVHPRHQYQRCKPMTSKNIGKNLLKGGKVTYGVAGERPTGDREKARRLKQLQRQADKAKL